MENHNLFLKKVSRLFPSSLTSCQSRTIPDVAESSIIITKTKKINPHSSHLLQKPPKPENNYSKVPKPCKSINHSSDAEGRKCPPVTPAVSTTINNPKKILEKVRKCSTSTSSSGRWFTSSDEITRAAADGFETDTFLSMSSNSGDSFRPKTTTRRSVRKREEMKSIVETGRRSFSSLASYDTVPSKCSRKAAEKGGKEKSTTACPEYELGCDHASTQLYYQKSLRRRKTAENRREVGKSLSRRSFSEGSMIEESFALEKSSSDPYSDFMASMVEMIIEKQMFGAEDLDRLLFCFLSLNKVDYHGIIFQVFTEICQTLFSD